MSLGIKAQIICSVRRPDIRLSGSFCARLSREMAGTRPLPEEASLVAALSHSNSCMCTGHQLSNPASMASSHTQDISAEVSCTLLARLTESAARLASSVQLNSAGLSSAEQINLTKPHCMRDRGACKQPDRRDLPYASTCS